MLAGGLKACSSEFVSLPDLEPHEPPDLEILHTRLHALNGDVLPILDALCLENLGEGAFALLGHKPVFVHDTCSPGLGFGHSSAEIP